MHGRISMKSTRGSGRSWKSVTLRIRRYKKLGHKHIYVETFNTKQQKVFRCLTSRCSAHYIFLLYHYTSLSMKNALLSIIFILSLTGIVGFNLGNTNWVPEKEVSMEDNDWGPEQDMTRPYCDIQHKIKIIDKINNKTYYSYWHEYCNF